MKDMFINPAKNIGIINGNICLNIMLRSTDGMVNKCGIRTNTSTSPESRYHQPAFFHVRNHSSNKTTEKQQGLWGTQCNQ